MNYALPQMTHSAADEQAEETHRRVDEVADAGQKYSGCERLGHQQHHAAANGEPLSGVAYLVRSKIDEAVEIFDKTSGNA